MLLLFVAGVFVELKFNETIRYALNVIEWFHGERLGSARLPPASSGFRVPNFEKRRPGGWEKSTPPAWRFCFCRRAVLIVFR